MPVALPGHSRDEFPLWVRAKTRTGYDVESITPEGLADIGRYVTGQPYYRLPPLGTLIQYSTWEEESQPAGGTQPAAPPGTPGSPGIAE